jgi:hypothetical protein
MGHFLQLDQYNPLLSGGQDILLANAMTLAEVGDDRFLWSRLRMDVYRVLLLTEPRLEGAVTKLL